MLLQAKNVTNSWIDIHSHFDMLETSPEETLKLAEQAGVGRIITIGTEFPDLPIVLKIAQELYPKVYCTLGVHPHHGSAFNQEVASFMETHLPDKEVVAVGEIGLDYYYKQSPIHEQKLAFDHQLEVAAQHKMNVEIHTRDAEQDTVEILKNYKGKVGGVIHCFTGTEWLAKQCLDLGFNISFSGIVTFKNADELRRVCKMVPLDRIHVETDAPFLTPVPLRGKKNTPAYVVHVAKFVAELKGVSEEQLSEACMANAKKIFPKIIW